MIEPEIEPILREFPYLSPAAFQHPLDVQAIANLRKVPLLAPIIKTISSSVFEKQMRLDEHLQFHPAGTESRA